MKERAPWLILAAALTFSVAAGEPTPETEKPKAPEPEKKADPAPATPAPATPATPAAPATPEKKAPDAPAKADGPQPQPQPQPEAQNDIKMRTDTAVAMRLLDDLGSADPAVVEASLKSIVTPLIATATKDETTFKYAAKTLKEYTSADKAAHDKAAQNLLSTFKDIRAGARQLQIEPRLLTLVENVAGPKPQETDISAAILNNALNQTLMATEIKAVIEQLASTDPAVVAAANKALIAYGADGVDLLIGGLGDDRLPIKDGAAELLKQLGTELIKGSAADIAYYLDNDDKHTRRLASKLLEGLGPDAASAMDDLVNYLDNDDKSVRRVAANILKKIGPELKEKTDDLVQLLSNDDKNTRSLATELLIHLGANAKEATTDLSSLLDDAQANDADVRQRSAKVLASIGPDAKEALEILKKYQADPDATVKDMVALAIKKIEGGTGEVKEEKENIPEDKEEKKDEKPEQKAEVKKDEKQEQKVEVKKEEKPEEKKEEKKQ